MKEQTRQCTPEEVAQPISQALQPGSVYRIEPTASPAWLARGLQERAALVRQGVPAARVWTLAEVQSAAGVLWPAEPTLGDVLDALSPAQQLEGAHE